MVWNRIGEVAETWSQALKRWKLSSLKISSPFLELELKWSEADRNAAWEIYIELLTRIATQPLPRQHGDEAAALTSLSQLFPITRDILRKNGPECVEVSKLAIVVLNQVVRPVTAKWHPIALSGGRNASKNKADFRADLKQIQSVLVMYTNAIGEIAGVEQRLTKL